MRNKNYTEARKRAWFMDQYKHPHESKHSYEEVLRTWFDANGFEFLSGGAQPDLGAFTPEEKLFEAQRPRHQGHTLDDGNGIADEARRCRRPLHHDRPQKGCSPAKRTST